MDSLEHIRSAGNKLEGVAWALYLYINENTTAKQLHEVDDEIFEFYHELHMAIQRRIREING